MAAAASLLAEATDLVGWFSLSSSDHRTQGPVLPAALGIGVMCGLLFAVSA